MADEEKPEGPEGVPPEGKPAEPPPTTAPAGATSATTLAKAPAAAAKPAAPENFEYGHVPLSEEMDSAKWKLPPLTIVLVGIGLMVVFGLMFGMIFRAQ